MLAFAPWQALRWCLSAPYPQRECSFPLVPSWHMSAAACHSQPRLHQLPYCSPSLAVVCKHMGSHHSRPCPAADSRPPSRRRQEGRMVPTSLPSTLVASFAPAHHQQALGSLQHRTSATRLPQQCSPCCSTCPRSSQSHDAQRLASCGDRHQAGVRDPVRLAQRQAAFSQQGRLQQPLVS